MCHAAVRMTLNAGVPAERRTTPELGVPPGRPPAAGCADLEVGVPWPGRHSPRWRGAERRTTPELGVLPGRPPAAACADRRSAFPGLGVTLHGGVGPRGEPPLNSGSFPAARPRRPVPTGGRRSLACASFCTVGWGREANHPWTRGPSRPPARGGLCRPEVGVPWPGRHSAWWRGAERRTTPERGILPGRPPAAACADLRSAFPGLHVTLHGGVEPRGEPPLNSGSFPAARLRRPVPTWRSAFPGLHVTLHGGVGPRGEPPPNAGSFPAARLRRAVPTWRSAFPGLHVTLHGGVGPRGEPPPKHPERTRTLSPPPP